MGLRWGYSPKLEQFIPLGEFPADRYLIIARQAIENLGWKLSHISASGIIAYTGLSLQSYSEEISIRIQFNFAVFKSECVGIQLLFTDYGKNERNAAQFFHEFEYVEYHLNEVWEQQLEAFRLLKEHADDTYFERSPLAVKNKIRNIFYLFYPRKGYIITPLLIDFCILTFFVSMAVLSYFFLKNQRLSIPHGRGYITGDYALGKIGVSSRPFLAKGQWWRLFSYQFLHLSISHLFFNMYALVYIGLMVEPRLGTLKIITIFLLSGVCGGILSAAFHPVQAVAGASGSIMGMFGAFIALLLLKPYEQNANRALLISTSIVVAYMLLLNGAGTKKVDQAAHFGGAIAGFVLAYAGCRSVWFGRKISFIARYGIALSLLAVILTSSFVLMPKDQSKEFEKLQRMYFNNSAVFNKVYQMPSSTPKVRRLTIVSAGVDSWSANKKIALKMDSLNLDKRSEMIVDYDKRIAEQGYVLAKLMYAHTVSGDDSRLPEIRKRATALNSLVTELHVKMAEAK
ncbi:rhomboid family intramembrane serine protease [Pedobacter duraquae]|uniref:Rhomboid protease GluP n=1 Tax=Pedobacter duraquae TaxID=425511 RepID=A0A4R6ICX2_9SPHI|nr:rhomboid family intramembrane serine protease [Pedobacter duraquae]TDO20120.1 rhomboid protease GluP [Pedobacter duraquae]